MNNRAWSLFELKSFDDDERTFEGVASTIETDRMGDIVEPEGAKFRLPIPLKWQHGKGDIKDPVGWVTEAKVSHSKIVVKGKFARLEEPPSLKEDLDRVWALVKSKLVRGLSIGFKPLESVPIKNSFGERFTSWEWLELSPVDIPANQSGTIFSVKSADASALAASGTSRSISYPDPTSHRPGVSGKPKGSPMKSITEKIRDIEVRQSEIQTRMAEIEESTEIADVQEFGTLGKELNATSDRLEGLRAQERAIATAKPIAVATGSEPAAASRARGGAVEVKSALPKGHGMARSVICLIRANGDGYRAAQLAKEYYRDSPEVELFLKATVAAGDTTTSGWASQLVPAATNLQNDFIELLRPATLIGRIPGLKHVPFNVSIPLETTGSTFTWVGESAPKPVSAMVFDAVTLRWAKAAGIVVITKELAKFSSPSAESIIKDSMVKQCTKFLDEQFINDAVAEVSNVSPGSILNGKAAAAATGGTTAGDFIYDLSVAMAAFVTSGNNPADAVILLSATNAYNLSIMRNSLSSSLEFPNLTISGGNIGGIPVVVSQSVGARLVVIKASEILLADEGGMEISVSDQASVEMSSTPIAGEASPITGAILQSFWQRNLIGIRVERFITWKRARTSAVEWISGAAYAPANPS